MIARGGGPVRLRRRGGRRGAAIPTGTRSRASELLLSRFADGTGAPLPAGGPRGARRRAARRAGAPAVRHGPDHHPHRRERARAASAGTCSGSRTRRCASSSRARSLFRALAGGGPARASSRTPTRSPTCARSGSRRTASRSSRSVRRRARGRRHHRRLRRRRRPLPHLGRRAAGRGLTHDITGQRARAPRRRHPARARRRRPRRSCSRLAEGQDLALFEFFETDEAGHARSMEARARRARAGWTPSCARSSRGLGPGRRARGASDHGNVEDLSTRNHTLAPVPVLGFGRAAGGAPRACGTSPTSRRSCSGWPARAPG